MYEITLKGIRELNNEEVLKIQDKICAQDNNYHIVVFVKQLNQLFAQGDCILFDKKVETNQEKAKRIVFKEGDVLSLYQESNLSLYPISNVDSKEEYLMDIENAEKHFNNIHYVNDNILKTQYIYLDFSNDFKKVNLEFLYRCLLRVIMKSSKLKAIYISKA